MWLRKISSLSRLCLASLLSFPGSDIRLPTPTELPRAAEDAATGAQLLGGVHEHEGEGARHRHGCDQTEAGHGAALLQGMKYLLKPNLIFNFIFAF